MRLRPLAETDDLEAVTSMIHRAYAPLAEQGLHYWATHQTVADTAERCARGETWVIEHDGAVVAMATLQTRGRGCDLYERDDVGSFHQLCVDPNHKGQGLAAQLLDHLEARAAALGLAELALDTSEHASGLIATYERRGYRFVGHADWRPKVNYRSVLLARRLRGEAPGAPTLCTERLLLRAVGLRDAPELQRHFATWGIIRNLAANVPWPYPEDGVRRWLEDEVLLRVEAGEILVWAICLAGDPEAAIGLVDWHPGGERGHRGFWLAEAHQGRGLMTEAVTAVQDHLFFERGIQRLLVLNNVHNAASRRVKEKTGARLLGTVRIAHHEGGDETQQWEVTREAWATLRGRGEPT